MCKCTPNIRTPFCGKPECLPPWHPDEKKKRGETRNSETLADFSTFCKENPDLRFWQALSVWKKKTIYVGENKSRYTFPIKVDGVFGREETVDGFDSHRFCETLKDTFNIENK
jgi:hypothetical protein